MANLYISAFGSDPGTFNVFMWLPLGFMFAVSMLVAFLFRKKSKEESVYVRYQGLIWSLINPLMLLVLSMAVPDIFAGQFGVVSCLIMIIAGAGFDRVASWLGSPMLAMLLSMVGQFATLFVLAITVVGCPAVDHDVGPNLQLGTQQTSMQQPAMQQPVLQQPAMQQPAMLAQSVVQPQIVSQPMIQQPLIQSFAQPMIQPIAQPVLQQPMIQPIAQPLIQTIAQPQILSQPVLRF